MSAPTNTGFGGDGAAPSAFIPLKSPGSGFTVDTTARTGKKKRRGRYIGTNSTGPSTPTAIGSRPGSTSPISRPNSAPGSKNNSDNTVTAASHIPESDSGSVKKTHKKKKNRKNRDRDIETLQNKIVQQLNIFNKLKGNHQGGPTSAQSRDSMNQFDALQSLNADVALPESGDSTAANSASPNAAAEESASEEYEPEYNTLTTGTAEGTRLQSSEEDSYDPLDFIPVSGGEEQPNTVKGELPTYGDAEVHPLRREPSIISISSDHSAEESMPNDIDNELSHAGNDDDANPAVEDDSFIAFGFSDEDQNDVMASESVETADAKGEDVDVNSHGRHQRRGILSKIAGALKIDSKRGKKRKREEEDISVIAPWTVGHDYSHEPEVTTWLHKEVQNFIDFVSPDDEQVERRASTVDRVQKCVKSLWSDATVCVFGSYATNLYLPDSDIDIVIISDSGHYDNRSSLYQLANALKSAKIAVNVEVIAKARVPIIKYTDRISTVNVDISFERYGGVVAANTILHWVAERPGLRELVMVIKYFLAKRDLNSVPNGGLGGFAVVCMVLSFFQMHPKIASGEIFPEENLGVLLVQFLELYGKNFNYDVVGISVTDNGSYFDKNRDRVLENRNRYSLAIRDPNDPTNNISRGTYNLRNIRRAFGGAYDILTTQCFEMDALSRRKWVGKSLLSSILYIEGGASMPYRGF
ncbi:hypothetical protein POJ06DRAFT_246891 [Lipomyces tetrasporus]|uniref:polynucleotide adenylyltransferase n=1 Tax=Lipomyces tetrasporus TaxID=54092 RepID=A0AAD7VVP1_9ASCO|nr:uncharacterized protein POJ06DRAFT_246891 [Lipomyces tetrasporus]KAJ8103211.1 hypothetical protein POJ06DRAFT_246891 [Lipomyces tetrasporus]